MLAAFEFGDSVQQAVDDVASFVPKLIGAALIFIVGRFVAKWLRSALEKVLTRIKFDEVVDRSGLGQYAERAGYRDSGRLLAGLVYLGIMLIVLKLAIGVFGDSPIQEALDDILAYVPKIFVAVIIILLTGMIANVVRDLVAPSVSHLAYDKTLVAALVGVIWFIGAFAALDQLAVAQDVVDTLFQYSVGAFFAILVIKFGVGGIWSARDRFWPAVYDRFEADAKD